MLVNVVGLLIISFIIGWFWLYKPKAIQAQDKIEILVKDGVYQPALIQAKINKPLHLCFVREDASPCAEVVLFSKLNLSKQLPLHKPVNILLNLNEAGEYEFTCQMGMYRGTIIAQ